jgi:hypothetical protein
MFKFFFDFSDFYCNEDKVNNYIIPVCYPGLVCASIYSEDSRWYRAVVLSVNKEEKRAEVFYVDWGNTEQIRFSDLRLLDDQFFQQPVLATPVSLHSVSSLA